MNKATVDSFNLRDFPKGEATSVWLSMARNGLGELVRVPLIVLRGARPGPTCGITAAVHGNEVNGIPVIHQLVNRIDVHKLRGAIVAVPVVNVMGYLLHQRRTDDGADINHLFPGKPVGRESVVYAWRFFEKVIKKVDFLLDLHTASFGRVNSLYVRADMTNPDTAKMAYLQRPQIIVHNPPADGTLRGAAAAEGIPAVTVEIGNPGRIQRDFIKRSTIGLRSVICAWGMLPKRPVQPGPPPFICKRSGWLYTDTGGLLEVMPKITDRVEPGDTLATVVDVFGEPSKIYRATEPAIVIGHSIDPVASTGARIIHLGIPAPEGSSLIPRSL